jgi:hypothetical protein
MTAPWSTTIRLRSRSTQGLILLWATPLCAAVGYGSYRAGSAVLTLLFGAE